MISHEISCTLIALLDSLLNFKRNEKKKLSPRDKYEGSYVLFYVFRWTPNSRSRAISFLARSREILEILWMEIVAIEILNIVKKERRESEHYSGSYSCFSVFQDGGHCSAILNRKFFKIDKVVLFYQKMSLKSFLMIPASVLKIFCSQRNTYIDR